MNHTASEENGTGRNERTDYADRPFNIPAGINFKCPQCAGGVQYSIEHGRMVCVQCGGKFGMSSFADPSESRKDGEAPEIETMEYRCPSCGASLYTTQTATTGFCSFCGSDVILKERVSSIRRPAKIIPFTLTRKDCEKIYLDRISQSPLIPREMKAEEAVGRFRPIYIPFWRVSGKGEGECKGEYDTVTVNGNYHVYDTYSAELTGKVKVTDILYDACSQFEDETAQWLQFSGKAAVPFHPAYLSGFYAEAPDLDSRYVTGLARDYAEECLSQALDDQSGITSAAVTLPENFTEEAELVLMPVWLLASRQGGRVIYTAINGIKKNKQMRCELPVSRKKFTLMTFALAAVLTALILFLHHYILLRPQIAAGLSCLLAAVCWNAAGPFLAEVNRKRNSEDPTRSLLETPKHLRDTKKISAAAARGTNDSRGFAIGPKKLLFPGLILAGILFLYVVFNRNPLRALNSLVSDSSALPPLLCVVSVVLLLIILYKCRSMSATDMLALLIQAGVGVIILFMKASAANKPVFYAISLISFSLTLLVLINAFRQHNIFVSRPSPLFEREEDDRK